MGGGLMAAKLCDSCKSATATVFCRADTAYLCMACDAKIHAANKLASRHARVWVCEVCEHAPATVTCKADAAHLCATCDRDIHSANPLARRHERVPLVPFFDSSTAVAAAAAAESTVPSAAAANAAAKTAAMNKLFGDDYYSDADEAEAASWLLPNPNPNKSEDPESKSIDYLFNGGGGGGDADGIDPYLDLDFGSDAKADPSADCVVPDPDHKQNNHMQQQQSSSLYSMPASSYHTNHFDNGYENHNSAACKPYSLSSYNTNTNPQPSLSHSVSSSSLDFGVVPDASAITDVASTGFDRQQQQQQQMKMVGMDREARVLRYREKRKNRKFEKTIRYASRKAYAETRPRIKGRFAKRTDVEAEVSAASVDSLFASDPGYGVVPSF